MNKVSIRGTFDVNKPHVLKQVIYNNRSDYKINLQLMRGDSFIVPDINMEVELYRVFNGEFVKNLAFDIDSENNLLVIDGSVFYGTEKREHEIYIVTDDGKSEKLSIYIDGTNKYDCNCGGSNNANKDDLYATDIELSENNSQTVYSKIIEDRDYLDNTRTIVDTNTMAIMELDNKIEGLEKDIELIENLMEQNSEDINNIKTYLLDLQEQLNNGDYTNFNGEFIGDFNSFEIEAGFYYYTKDTVPPKPAQDLGPSMCMIGYETDDDGVQYRILTFFATTSQNDIKSKVNREKTGYFGPWRGFVTQIDMENYTYNKEHIELNDLWNKDIADTFHNNKIGELIWNWDISSYAVGALTSDMLPANEFNEGLERAEVVNDGVENSIRVKYPANVYNTGASGCQIEYHFTGGEHYVCEFDMLFETGFSFGGDAKGGKIPGLTNTVRNQPEFYNNGLNGWSARPMWRGNTANTADDYDWVPDDKITLVSYLYQKREGSEYGTLYGDDVLPNRKDDYALFEAGKWYNIKQEVKLNSNETSHDGYVKYWIDDRLLLSKYGLKFTEDMTKNIDTFFFSTFHGGDTQDFAPLNDSYAQFKNMKVNELITDEQRLTAVETQIYNYRYYEEIRTDSHNITNSDGVVSVAKISGYEAGKYEVRFNCLGTRTYTSEQTITVYLMMGEIVIFETTITTGSQKVGPMNWQSPIDYDLNGDDLEIRIEFDGGSGLTISDVQWSIKGWKN